jgi:hypothetical protein
VDWISASKAKGAGASDLIAFIAGVVEDEVNAGNEAKPFTWRGYKGYKAGRASWAANDDYAICSLESDLADRWHRSVAALADNVSRIDLQVTAISGEYTTDDYALRAWEMLGETGYRVNSRRGYQLIQNSRGGSTLYVGSRRSSTYLRLYDKSVESPGYELGTWRFEAELKEGRAKEAMAVARDVGWSPTLTAGAVYQHFALAGMASPFLPIQAFGLRSYHGIQPIQSAS